MNPITKQYESVNFVRFVVSFFSLLLLPFTQSEFSYFPLIKRRHKMVASVQSTQIDSHLQFHSLLPTDGETLLFYIYT